MLITTLIKNNSIYMKQRTQTAINLQTSSRNELVLENAHTSKKPGHMFQWPKITNQVYQALTIHQLLNWIPIIKQHIANPSNKKKKILQTRQASGSNNGDYSLIRIVERPITFGRTCSISIIQNLPLSISEWKSRYVQVVQNKKTLGPVRFGI